MRNALTALITLALLSAGVHAQPTNPFIGRWKVSVLAETKKGTTDERDALLVITADGGSWRTFRAKGGRDPCRNQEWPVEISHVDAKQLIAKIRRSKVVDFCSDQGLVLVRDEQDRVIGRLGESELTLVKE